MTVEMVHLTLPCPICGDPAAVVASVADERSRWCCVGCGVVGALPLRLDLATLPAGVLHPIASA
jgi:hypothetical protein